MALMRQENMKARRLLGLMAVLSAVMLVGCGGEEVAKLEDYLEELEFDRPLESGKEIKVNSYRFPVAAGLRNEAGADISPMWVQMKFDLYVIATEEDEKVVLAAIERHRGMLDDTVLSICRQSSIEQLQDNRWSSLKTRLLEAIRPLLGKTRVRQIAFDYSAPWEPI